MEIDSERSLNALSKGETEEDEPTPRPTKKDKDQLHHIFDLSADNDSEPFQTPLPLRRKKRVVLEDSDPDEQLESEGMQKEVLKRKRGQTGGSAKKKERKGDRKKVRVTIETLS